MEETNTKNLPTRKPNRLKGYNYSRNGVYFVTICAKNHEEIFGFVGANCVRPQLFGIGKIVDDEIKVLSSTYQNITVSKYVIMPNHIHMILVFANGGRQKRERIVNESASNERRESGRTQFAPTTLSQVIKQWKGAITKKVGFSIWQKSFHDHIIRDKMDYRRIAEYIESNPATWREDCFYGMAVSKTAPTAITPNK